MVKCIVAVAREEKEIPCARNSLLSERVALTREVSQRGREELEVSSVELGRSPRPVGWMVGGIFIHATRHAGWRTH